MMESQEPVRLLDLPPELRTLIHEHIFRNDSDSEIPSGPRLCKPPVILFASRQIYCEATPVFYSTTTFEVSAIRLINLQLPAHRRTIISQIKVVQSFTTRDKVDFRIKSYEKRARC